MVKENNEISLKFKIERSNELNKLNPRGMNLTEIRFLAIYQAKINARNPESKTVTFSLEEFCKIMQVKELNVPYIKKVADSIICKPVHLPDGKGGLYVVPLFNDCHIRVDDKSKKWYVDITCHDKVLPYMFEMKKNYFTYELWNALKLRSVNQVRMYEILKQYEKLGTRIIELNELKCLLGIDVSQYDRYQDFRRKVLELCQKALEKYTDIKFSFEPIKQGRKIYALKFKITKNKNFKDDLKLREFIKPEDLSDIMDIQQEQNIQNIEVLEFKRKIQSLYYKCDERYTLEQLEILYNMVESSKVVNLPIEFYISSIYQRIKVQHLEIKSWYAYTLKTIINDLDELASYKNQELPKKRETTYNLDEFMDFTMHTPRDMGGHHFSIFNKDGWLVAYLYEKDFDTIKNGTWKIKYPNCRIDEVSNRGLKLIDLINS